MVGKWLFGLTIRLFAGNVVRRFDLSHDLALLSSERLLAPLVVKQLEDGIINTSATKTDFENFGEREGRMQVVGVSAAVVTH